MDELQLSDLARDPFVQTGVLAVVGALITRVLLRKYPARGLAFQLAFFLALTALLMLLSVGIVRGWRWLFWLILIAFLAGILRVPAAALELAGKIPQQGPAWYVVLTAIVGMIQFVVALTMAAGYRRSGVWGE